MKDITKHYTKENLTVVWKPEQCIHSTKCWKGLIEVFDPRKRPWINMEGAEMARIMEQVSMCPSGALSYVMKDEEINDDKTETDIITSVEVMKNGPLLVYGNIMVKDSRGHESSKSKVTAFCRCGASSNKPYCDGTHIKIGFKDE